MDRLLAKNAEGTITPKERITLEQLVAEAERLMVANARRLEDFSAGKEAAPSAQAVPVTMWIQPTLLER